MAKTEKIQVVSGCIHYGPRAYLPGETFDCEAKEAKRLIAAGIAGVPTAAESKTDEQHNNADLLAAIAAAETTADLLAIIPADEPAAEIAAAFEAKMAELDAA